VGNGGSKEDNRGEGSRDRTGSEILSGKRVHVWGYAGIIGKFQTPGVIACQVRKGRFTKGRAGGMGSNTRMQSQKLGSHRFPSGG